MSSIKYIKDMKYCLSSGYTLQTPVTGYNIEDPWFILNDAGYLYIKPGFCWDGPSGPTLDTKDSLKASMVHDVFCILMRDGRIDYNKWQDTVNGFFMQMCIEDGMPAWRAKLWYMGVEFGDAGNPKQGPDRKVYEAP